MIAAQLFD